MACRGVGKAAARRQRAGGENGRNPLRPECPLQPERSAAADRTEQQAALSGALYVQHIARVTLCKNGELPERFFQPVHHAGGQLSAKVTEGGFQLRDKRLNGSLSVPLRLLFQRVPKGAGAVPQTLGMDSQTILLQQVSQGENILQGQGKTVHLAGGFGQLVGLVHDENAAVL